MKKQVFLILSILFCIQLRAQSESKKMNIIPAPVQISFPEGSLNCEQLSVSTIGFVQIPLNLVEFAQEIVASADKKEIRDFRKSISDKPGLVLILDKSIALPAEGYALQINKNGIRITSASESGVFYGLQSLMQLMPEKGKSSVLPFVEMEDYPRFHYRGLHLDVGRHFFSVAFIKKYIDLMAQYKLNIFHWHLTEDQGWRIEIKKYPELTKTGAYRNQTIIGYLKDQPQRFDGIRYGGYYTQEEVKEVVAYAASRYITIVPEIEMPGHALAALSAYPGLACGTNSGPFKAAEKWGVFPDVFCAGKEETFQFLEDVLEEVLALFPSEYIHIGGDECPKKNWESCPYCQKRIQKQKLKNEHELQSYFIGRIEKYLNKKGRQIIGWDEILEGGLAPNATVMSWRGVKGGIAAAQQQHDVIMTPNTYLYLDYRESTSPEEPLTIGKNLPIEKVYSYDPASEELTPEQQKYIKGVQANVWTEYMQTPEKVFYMIFPRLFALSEIAWTPVKNKNWKNFSEERMPVHLAALEKDGINFRVPVPIGVKDTTVAASSFTLSCEAPVEGSRVYYTIDGYTPTEKDLCYSEPITIPVPEGEERIIKTVTITSTGKKSIVVTTKVVNSSEAKAEKNQ